MSKSSTTHACEYPKQDTRRVFQPIPNTSKPTSTDDSTDHAYADDSKKEIADEWQSGFRDIWADATSDHRLTLFGFKRFRTSHLINLRFLAQEIEKVDQLIFQAGIQLDQPISKLDRLGLGSAKKLVGSGRAETIIDDGIVRRLRDLIKQYDDALLAMNSIMSMETFALADNLSKAARLPDVQVYEKFKTRLVRVDLPRRGHSRDPIQHFLRKAIRRVWYWMYKERLSNEEDASRHCFPIPSSTSERIWGNTARIAEISTRFFIALVAAAALVCPLAILSAQNSAAGRLLVVVICIVVFCMAVATLSKASNYEAMAVSAAYAAVLTVFLSNSPSS